MVTLYLKGHITVERPNRLDAVWTREQGTNSEKVSLAHSHVLLKTVLRVIVTTTLAAPIPCHKRLPPIHFHFLKPATYVFFILNLTREWLDNVERPCIGLLAWPRRCWLHLHLEAAPQAVIVESESSVECFLALGTLKSGSL